MKRDIEFLSAWIGLSVLGMTLGAFAAIEIIGLAVFRLDLLYGLPGGLALLVILLFAGGAHGAVMGLGQAMLLRRRIHAPMAPWVLASALGAGLACALGGVANLVSQEPWDPSERTTAIFLGGMALGGVLGLAQWLVLKRQVADSTAWIPANSLAWIAAMGLGVRALDALGPNASDLDMAVAVLLGTVLPGVVAGAITGVTMLALLFPVHREA